MILVNEMFISLKTVSKGISHMRSQLFWTSVFDNAYANGGHQTYKECEKETSLNFINTIKLEKHPISNLYIESVSFVYTSS